MEITNLRRRCRVHGDGEIVLFENFPPFSPEQSWNVTRPRPQALLYRSDKEGGGEISVFREYRRSIPFVQRPKRPKNLIRTLRHDGLP